MFIEGFFTALGAMAAVALVSMVVIIPAYLYIRKEINVLREGIEVMKKGQENLANFEGTPQ